MFKNRARIVVLLMALAAGSVGFAVFAASNAPATQPQNGQTVTGQTAPTASQANEASSNESETAGESETASASDGPGGSQHQFQGQETGQH